MKKFRFNLNNPKSNTATAAAEQKNKSIHMLIIDESGSMVNMRSSTIETYHTIISQIYADRNEYPGLEQYINLWSFGDITIKERIPPTLVSSTDFPKFTYNPAGGTPLYDALGNSLLELERFLNTPEMQGNQLVNVTVITDGEENSSREFTHPEIARLINRLKEKNWNFQYFGTEHDVEKAAQKINITESASFVKSDTGMKNVTHAYYALTRVRLDDWMKEFDDSLK